MRWRGSRSWQHQVVNVAVFEALLQIKFDDLGADSDLFHFIEGGLVDDREHCSRE